jgi:hypothetical protein
MTIQIQIRNVYGNELVYPVCEQAKLFTKLLCVKTFNYHQIETLKQLGYSFEAVTVKPRNI